MSEYIERDAAMLMPVLPKEYRQYQTENLDDAYEQGWLDATGNLKNVPAADVVPVELFNDLRNELCLHCGKYTLQHFGACDGCKWRANNG